MIAPSQLPHLINEFGTPRPQASPRARRPRRHAVHADAAVSIRLAGDRDRTTLREVPA